MMLFKTVFLIVGLSQVLALPTEPSYHDVDFIENVRGDFELDVAPSIVSGWQAYPGQHPHQIYLRMANQLGELAACGGSVVHANWFITAAHCTAQKVRLLVRAGLIHIASPQYDAETTLWYNHPTYNDALPQVVQPNDISIAYLPQPVTFTHVLQPIRIQPAVDAYRNYDGETVIASGFGRIWSMGATSDVLNWVYLTGVSNAFCFSTFGTIVTDTTICARFFNDTTQSTCQGDSGGPLVHVDSEGVPVLIGVAAFVADGATGCHSGYPAGFTRPGPFQSWFAQVTGIDFENLEETTEPPTEAPTTTEAPTPEPPTTEPPTTEPPTTEPPTTEPPVTEPPTTENPDSEEEVSTEAPEPEEDTSEEKGSDESNDCELSELLKKLEVKVRVDVKLNKYGKKKKKRN